MEENKNSNGVTINLNFNASIEAEAVKNVVDFLRSWNILPTVNININPTEDAAAPRQKRKYTRKNNDKKSASATASDNKKGESAYDGLDIMAVCKTIREYAPDEADFLARLDAMTEQAFDDQCTGANPRYPLMSEIKQMYLNAYYGKHENV